MESSTSRVQLPGNRRLHLLLAGTAGILVGVLLAVVLLGGGGDDDAAPASGTAGLVPASALVYLHLSTDGERDGTRQALQIARGFPGWNALRDRTVRQLVAAGRDGAQAAGVTPFLGDEAALALTDRGTETAGSLVMLQVTDQAAANRYLEKGQATVRESEARGIQTRTFGTLVTAIIGDILVIGQLQSVREAIELSTGRGDTLADDPSYQRAMEGMPADRAADAWATADGIRRLLAPQGGALGIAGALLDAPGLRATALALTAEEDGLNLRVRRLVDPDAQGKVAGGFDPSLAEFMPDDVFAFADLRNLTGVAQRFLSLAAQNTEARTLLEAAQQGGALEFLKGEVGVGLSPGVPASVLTLVARTDDEEGARKAMKSLKAPLVGDVVDGRVIVSTSAAGLSAAKDPDPPLSGTEIFKKTVGDSDNGVSSLLFLDFTQLLRLGEQTGLRDNREYLAVAPDLEKVQAVGVSSTAEEGSSTSEIFFLIP
ncbi:DUF3352 domain-containing protein [Svornostia abyssi]|uniref:DUF3352 domain-containing protein n=1 Tax=Svornostia abyssi TaxID=2898438 RepID=A0ABY5PBX2_9ACTN|nr:DUF3352 domain-containing protein [Parviterribacteraceae bacterium J379]